MTAEAAMMPVQPLEQTEYVGAHRAAEAAALEEAATTRSWRTRLGQIAGRAALVLGVAVGGTAVISMDAQPAEAKVQGVCKGPLWGNWKQQTCLLATMGEKDHDTHREWVERVEVSSPDAGPGMLEIWGDGFYEKKYDETWAGWDVRKFVSNDTNICAAGTDNEGNREIACFHIEV